jgi:hypothetical protein
MKGASRAFVTSALMRAVLCKAYGPPESLVVEEIDDPVAEPARS